MMDEKELKAMISLLDDPDKEVSTHIESNLLLMGEKIIPFLEEAWETTFDPDLHNVIENLVHRIQFNGLVDSLRDWIDKGGEDLLEGMWIVCKYQYPDLEIQTIRDQIADIYRAVFLELNNNLTALEQVKVINYIIFTIYKFSGNTSNFHNPSNSLINKVLETKKGNPISLCIIYLLVSKTLKLPIYGVNLPNLFVLTYKKDDLQFYINVFNKGVIFSKKDIDQYLIQLNLKPSPEYYEPCDHKTILDRVFRNLQAAFEKLGEIEKAKEISKLITHIK